MDLLPTPKFRPAPCVMLVAVEDTLAHRLGELVKVPLLRVLHAPAARERLMVTWPLALLIGDNVARSDLETLREAAEGIGIEMLCTNHLASEDQLQDWLTRAMSLALQRRQGPHEKS